MSLSSWVKISVSVVLLLASGVIAACNVEKVPAGYVGIKVYLLGTSKGVDHEALGPGRYWIGLNQDLFLFPTFKQNHAWKHESDDDRDESITFQTKEGLAVNADVGVMYSIQPQNVPTVFQSYRRGVAEITDTFLRNTVRDAFNSVASDMGVEDVYGSGKARMMGEVEERARAAVAKVGVDIERLYIIGSLRLPARVSDAINLKIEATQRAIMRENELREAEAEAKKKVAAAQGEANSVRVQAEADAASITLRADAQAAANLKMAKTLTRELVEYERVKKWDGALPHYSGNGSAIFSFKDAQGS